MGKSLEDLKAAFAGESQANRKYAIFAKKAEEEGYQLAAKLFRAASAAEAIHAARHLRTMLAVKTTAENLQAAIDGEHYEVNSMYPEFMQDAESENEKTALASFKKAWEVEKVHEVLYRDMLANLSKEGEQYDFYLCPICGHIHARFAPDVCPICGATKDKFERF
ncbi:MAG TPA: rubrerythrin family protein [Candidatus Gracilibacteria bacterium]|nr:rubrerythrin family protein [Candidatus Gracilibacteria bacterium]